MPALGLQALEKRFGAFISPNTEVMNKAGKAKRTYGRAKVHRNKDMNQLFEEWEELRDERRKPFDEVEARVDLEVLVRDWITTDNSPPLFILANYGKGKSTFATHFAAKMAEEALADQTRRTPILVRLGEIVDEQSLEGLLGKVLASRYRIPQYHFDTFMELNRLGRFVVIYDGFDEMKHGMTFSRFQEVLSELMRLDEGDARVLVLGRHTALHDEKEFKAVINGRQITAAGQDIPAPNRRVYKTAEIRGFTIDEAHQYVRRYFPIRAREICKQAGAVIQEDWLQRRIKHLVSGAFDDLLQRPVHAQMLCDVAAYPEFELDNLTVCELFDRFIHYLLERETKKKGRDSSFDRDKRRAFNATLAWWLWERGGAAATTLNEIPLAMCQEAAKGGRHNHDDVALKRELIQGCLIEKSADIIYFGYRSLQEFLAAEHLISTNLLAHERNAALSLERALKNITPEIINFIVTGVQMTSERREMAFGWFDERLRTLRGNNISLQGFNLFPELARELDVQIEDPTISPWILWAYFFQRTGAKDFTQHRRETFSTLAELLMKVQYGVSESQAAALYALAKVLQGLRTNGVAKSAGIDVAVAAMLPIKELKSAVVKAADLDKKRPPSFFVVRQDESFLLWAFLRASEVIEIEGGRLALSLDAAKLQKDVERRLRLGFADELDVPSGVITFPVQQIYQRLASFRVSNKDIDGIRPFFNNVRLRSRIKPLEVQRAVLRSPAAPLENTSLTPIRCRF